MGKGIKERKVDVPDRCGGSSAEKTILPSMPASSLISKMENKQRRLVSAQPVVYAYGFLYYGKERGSSFSSLSAAWKFHNKYCCSVGLGSEPVYDYRQKIFSKRNEADRTSTHVSVKSVWSEVRIAVNIKAKR